MDRVDSGMLQTHVVEIPWASLGMLSNLEPRVK